MEKRVIVLVNPVDGDKVDSIREALGGDCRLVVIVEGSTERFNDLPDVEVVTGSLRRRRTYERAGLDQVSGVVVCASTYNDPKQADELTALVVRMIRSIMPNLPLVAEVISRNNRDLLPTDIAVVMFDPTTLQAVASLVKSVIGDQPCKPEANTVDEFQRDELWLQFSMAGVVFSADGETIAVVLPADLDHPEISDAQVLAAMTRTRARVCVGLFLSTGSADVFREHPNVLCADQLMALALAAALTAAQVRRE